ncbi:MAG: serine/threonine protein kinase [Deltaproteobacteria bacterium]|nr:serine/threonine protein kinase [Deltaproteobacteria bacterium]
MAQTPMDPKDSEPPLPLVGEGEAPRDDPSGIHALEPDELVGRTILDRYQILQRIGEGGMGAVYLALHTIIEKKVVLKVLHGEYGRKPELVERFLHEAKTASKIRHENVVDITDFGRIPGGTVFIAMEYLKGHDLSDHIKDHGPLKWKHVKPIALQICAALEEAHNVGVVHRDLKPENIFLIKRGAREDFVKILDFGIAKMTELDESGKRLTRTGMVFGTPEYMAPEQARGEKTDRRVDVYAMGCILYEMLCGDVPFRAQSFMGVLTKHIFDPVVRLSAQYPELGVPPAVEAVVLKALDKDRDRRYQSMAELGAALESVDSAGHVQAASAARMAASGSMPSMQAPPMFGHVQPGQVTDPSLGMANTMPSQEGMASEVRKAAAAAVAAQGQGAAARGVGAAADDGDADWQPPKRTGLKVGLALGGLALVGAVVAAVLLGGGGKKKDSSQGGGASASPSASASASTSPNPSPSPGAGVVETSPAPVTEAMISVVTTPAGATVTRAGVVEGKTPITLKLDPAGGTQTLTLTMQGFKESVLDVAVDKDREYVINLDKLDPVVGKGTVKKGTGKKSGGKKTGGKKGGSDEIKDPFGP